MSSLTQFIPDTLRRIFSGRTDKFTSPPQVNFNQLFQPSQAQYETIDGRESELFATTGVLQIVIMKKASMKSVGTWKHKRMLKDGTTEDLGETDYIKLLNNPNPLQSKDEFLKQFEINKSVFGADFVYGLKGFDAQDVPSALYNIEPEKMTINSTGKIYQQTKIEDIISSYIFDKGGAGQYTYKPNEILYLHTPNPQHPIFPISPLVGLTMEISNIRASAGYANVILRKKGAIGILSNQSRDGNGAIPLNKTEKEQIEKQYQRDYGISESQSQVLITQASLNWLPMTYPTKDLLLLEQDDANTRKIIDRYGLNYKLFSFEKGQSMSDSGGGMLEAERIAYINTIIPESIDDAEAITRYLNVPENEYLELDYSHLPALKDDEVKKSEILKLRVESYKILREQGMDETRALIMSGLEQSE